MTEPTIWVHSADSHVMEPEDLWMRNLPASLASRAPVSYTHLTLPTNSRV